MNLPLMALLGTVICCFEGVIILAILNYLLFDIWDFDVGGVIVYGIVILLANVLPLIFSHNLIFAWSTGCGIVTIILVALIYTDEGFYGYSFESYYYGILIVFLIGVLGAGVMKVVISIDSDNFKEVDKSVYETHYKIASSDDQYGVKLVSSGEDKSSYYVIMYEDKTDSGETMIQVLQIPFAKIDVSYAIEEQKDNYLIVYKTDHVYEREKDDSVESKTETTYSYKLCINRDFPIFEIVPQLK